MFLLLCTPISSCRVRLYFWKERDHVKTPLTGSGRRDTVLSLAGSGPELSSPSGWISYTRTLVKLQLNFTSISSWPRHANKSRALLVVSSHGQQRKSAVGMLNITTWTRTDLITLSQMSFQISDENLMLNNLCEITGIWRLKQKWWLSITYGNTYSVDSFVNITNRE